MGKYNPLTQYLQNQPVEIWDARFSDIERVLGFALPRSAHEYPAWWANQERGHSQTRGWQDAGWETGQVDLSAKKVRFKRKQRPPAEASGVDKATRISAGPSLEELYRRAHEISEIADREELTKAALTALIRREAARHLSAMGGTMPDFKVPARERPTW